MYISLTRPESICLKRNGQKTYNRITDFNPILDNPIEQKAFPLKNSAIIRQIVDNPKIQNVFLDMYYFDCVNRIGTDRYDEPDNVYGIRVLYEQPLAKHLLFVGEYRWQTESSAHKDYNLPTEYFIARVVTQGLPVKFLGKTGHQMMLLYKEHQVQGDKLIDTSKYTSFSAITKYKAEIMRRKKKNQES